MSSLWTPDGERPVARPSSPAGGAPPGDADEPVDDEALAAEVEAMRAQLAKAATNGDQEAAALLQAYRSNK